MQGGLGVWEQPPKACKVLSIFVLNLIGAFSSHKPCGNNNNRIDSERMPGSEGMRGRRRCPANRSRRVQGGRSPSRFRSVRFYGLRFSEILHRARGI